MAATAEAPTKGKKKYLFQVLAGQHWEAGEVTDDTGRKVIKDIKYGPGSPHGDLIETDVELDKRFNQPPYSIKFKRVGEGAERDAKMIELQAEKQKVTSAQTGLKSALEKMPRAELVAWAEEQEIDLGGAQKREDVLRVILGTLG